MDHDDLLNMKYSTIQGFYHGSALEEKTPQRSSGILLKSGVGERGLREASRQDRSVGGAVGTGGLTLFRSPGRL